MNKDIEKLLVIVQQIVCDNWNDDEPNYRELTEILDKNKCDGIDLDELVKENTNELLRKICIDVSVICGDDKLKEVADYFDKLNK